MNNIQAIDLLKGLEQSLDDYCELNDEGKTAFRMAIAALELFGNAEQLSSVQPEQKWIPCSERLPEESGRYLVSVLDGVGRRTTVAPYQLRYKAWTMTGRMAYWKVIAWMPLPEPYWRGGEDE